MPNPSEEHIRRLKTAFSIHVARMIAEADQILDYAELEHLGQAFPTPDLQALGYLDDNGRFTSRFDEDLAEALAVLPLHITLAEKLEMVSFFHTACLVDGDLDPRELKVLMHAAQLVDLSEAALARHLDEITHGRRAPPIRSG